MRIFQAFLCLCIILTISPLHANHIAGGDFTVRHIQGNTFEATLVLYRDCEGNLVTDNSIAIAVFDAATDAALPNLSFFMSDPVSEIIDLANSCYDTGLCVESQTYTQIFTLPDNPSGYYMSWERCCRNELAINVTAANQSMVFTVEVPDPALQNSSPQFQPYPSEAFLCINGPAQIDFGATDVDGDSLVYSMIAPLRGNFTSTVQPIYGPGSGPRPYPGLAYTPAYSLEDPVGGETPLELNPATGLVTAQPTTAGFYSLAVKVEEYRDGVKIGEVIREAQIAALTCQIDFPSEIFTPEDQTVFEVPANSPWCIEVDIIDPNTGDSLFVEATGELFDGTVSPQAIFPSAESISEITRELCWQPLCHNVRDEPYVVTITAFSRGCAEEVFVTEQDILIHVILEEDEPTALTSPLIGGVPGIEIDLYDPSTHCFSFTFEDPNTADSLFITPTSDIFNLVNTDVITEDEDQGTLSLPFCWEVVCGDVRDEPYFIEFEVITTNCEVEETSFFSVPIHVVVPENEPTLISEPVETYTFEFYSAAEFCIPVTVGDANFFDTLQVTATSELFDLTANPASFDTLNGLSLLNDTVCWAPRCSDVRPEPYFIEFTATAESCKTADTVSKTIEINLVLPEEEESSVEVIPGETEIEHIIGGESIAFTVSATDPNPTDTLTLTADFPDFTTVTGAPEFSETSGILQLVSDFSWLPNCSHISDEPYTFTFEVNARSCQKDVSRFVDVDIAVFSPTRGDIAPIANIFTPNGDGRNDRWKIEDEEDACLIAFKAVVFDRWGREVFTSNNPAFEWDGTFPNGSKAADGTYYRVIEYVYNGVRKSYAGEVNIAGSNPSSVRR